jgi:hypothetical protein
VEDAAIFMFFDRKLKALTVPNDGSIELVPISPGRHRCNAIDAVALHSVPRRPGSSEGGSLHDQIGTAVIDVSDDIARSFWHASFVALLPCSREVRLRWQADAGRGKKKRRE